MDGGYILAGVTHSFNLDVIGNHGDHDFWVVKIDSVGNMLWSQCLGGSLSDNGDFIKETADGGFLVAGMSASSDGMLNFNHGKYDFWVVKLTSAGSAEWQYSLGGSQDEECLSLSENTDGSITLAGYSSSNDGDVSGNHGLSDFWIVKCSLPVFHTYYADTDGDSFGDANNKIIAEEPPAGYVTNSLDCNDSNSAIHPGAIDDCNGIDDDCDFYIDENFITANIWPLTTATICNTSQLTLHCDTAEGYTYQWLTGSQPIAGATNSSYVVTRAGKYSVKITKGLCTANSPQTIIKITFQNVSVSPTGTTKVCGSTPVMFSVPNSPGLIYQWYGPEGLITGATGAYFPATKPGDYYVNISDIVGCSFNSSTSTLIYSPAAEVFISATGKLNICTTGSVTLNALINSDYDYEWYRNGGAIAGATNSYYVATEAGSYKYLATTSDGCTAFSKSKNVTDCKEVHEGDEIISGGSLKIFPNPSAGNFIAEFQTDDSFSGDGLLQIYNLTGQIVQSASVEIIKGSLQFHLSLPNNLPGGTYFVKLFADGTEFLSRITLAR